MSASAPGDWDERGSTVPAPAAETPLEALCRRARQLDERAIELLTEVATPTMATCVAIRNLEIVEIDAWLQGVLPGASLHQRCQIIAAAGASLDVGDKLPERKPFSVLDRQERADLASRIRPFRRWNDVRWPGWQQVGRIINGE